MLNDGRVWLEYPVIVVLDALTYAGNMDNLTDVLGHEVEGYEVLGPGWSDVVVGRVETIEAHPDAVDDDLNVDERAGDLPRILPIG